MTPCQRCIGGQMLAGACLQCGYRPPLPDPLPYVPRVGSELARRVRVRRPGEMAEGEKETEVMA